MHKTFFNFWDSRFIRVAWKYISGVLFLFRNISGPYFQPRHQISSFLKKLEMRFLQHISLLQQKIPLFLPRSWDMVKPLLEMKRVDPRDAFTYLSCSHIMSTSNFRIREKKFPIFHFYAYFLKGNFKELPEKLFSARFQLFFSSNSKNFSIMSNHVD